MKIELTKEQISLLEIGSKLQYSENEFIYFLPIWFKIKNSSNTAEVYHLDKLPNDIKEIIEQYRHEISTN